MRVLNVLPPFEMNENTSRSDVQREEDSDEGHHVCVQLDMTWYRAAVLALHVKPGEQYHAEVVETLPRSYAEGCENDHAGHRIHHQELPRDLAAHEQVAVANSAQSGHHEVESVHEAPSAHPSRLAQAVAIDGCFELLNRKAAFALRKARRSALLVLLGARAIDARVSCVVARKSARGVEDRGQVRIPQESLYIEEVSLASEHSDAQEKMMQRSDDDGARRRKRDERVSETNDRGGKPSKPTQAVHCHAVCHTKGCMAKQAHPIAIKAPRSPITLVPKLRVVGVAVPI